MTVRKDRCKCGKFLTWDPCEVNDVTCKKCGTKFKVECDSVLVYWLEEDLPRGTPFITEAR